MASSLSKTSPGIPTRTSRTSSPPGRLNEGLAAKERRSARSRRIRSADTPVRLPRATVRHQAGTDSKNTLSGTYRLLTLCGLNLAGQQAELGLSNKLLITGNLGAELGITNLGSGHDTLKHVLGHVFVDYELHSHP